MLAIDTPCKCRQQNSQSVSMQIYDCNECSMISYWAFEAISRWKRCSRQSQLRASYDRSIDTPVFQTRRVFIKQHLIDVFKTSSLFQNNIPCFLLFYKHACTPVSTCIHLTLNFTVSSLWLNICCLLLSAWSERFLCESKHSYVILCCYSLSGCCVWGQAWIHKLLFHYMHKQRNLKDWFCMFRFSPLQWGVQVLMWIDASNRCPPSAPPVWGWKGDLLSLGFGDWPPHTVNEELLFQFNTSIFFLYVLRLFHAAPAAVQILHPRLSSDCRVSRMMPLTSPLPSPAINLPTLPWQRRPAERSPQDEGGKSQQNA